MSGIAAGATVPKSKEMRFQFSLVQQGSHATNPRFCKETSETAMF